MSRAMDALDRWLDRAVLGNPDQYAQPWPARPFVYVDVPVAPTTEGVGART